jgi:glucose-1-phosphate thymidylyltransferase
MKLVIPMAGFGTRMRPHTWTRPKPLLPLAGRPILDHVLDRFNAPPIAEYVFIVGWLGNQVKDYIRATHSIPAHFVEQKEMLGQAHAIWLAREYLQGPLFLTWVDTLFDDADFSKLDNPGIDGIIFTQEVDDPRRFGVVEMNSAGRATKLIEKPESMANKNVLIGLYYFRDGAWLTRACAELMERRIQTKGEYYLADAINLMIEQGANFRTRPVGVWQDTGKPETTFITHRYLLDNGSDNSYEAPRPGIVVVPPVFIHPEAIIEHSVIGPYVSIGKHARVHNCILKDSIIDAEVEIESVLLEKSIIGRWVRLTGHFRNLNIGDSSIVL